MPSLRSLKEALTPAHSKAQETAPPSSESTAEPSSTATTGPDTSAPVKEEQASASPLKDTTAETEKDTAMTSSSNLPKTFKAAVFKEKGGPLVLEDRELQHPKPGTILVKVEACGVCHSDQVVQAGVMSSFPIIPGHEAIGRIVAVGQEAGESHAYGAERFKVGDRVGAAWHGGHDGSCRACQLGYYQMCENEEINGVTRDGGYAEYVTLRSEAAVPIPDDIDAAKFAPLLCAGVTVFNSMRQQHKPPGSLVAIQGLGGLGHLAIQYARKAGYRVVAVSSSGSKEEFARKLGAHEYLDGSKVDIAESLQKLGGADIIVATAPNSEIVGKLVGGLGILGKLLILALAGEIKVDTTALIQKGTSVGGWPSGHALDSKDAIEFARVHDVDCLVETFPLSDVQKAFDHMVSGKVRFRSVIVF